MTNRHPWVTNRKHKVIGDWSYYRAKSVLEINIGSLIKPLCYNHTLLWDIEPLRLFILKINLHPTISYARLWRTRSHVEFQMRALNSSLITMYQWGLEKAWVTLVQWCQHIWCGVIKLLWLKNIVKWMSGYRVCLSGKGQGPI